MYKYELINNHYIVNIDGNKMLLDTGSPISFWMNNESKELRIDGNNYFLRSKPSNLDISKTKELVGIIVDGFIGMDIIHQTSLTIYKNGDIDFAINEVDGKEIELHTFGASSIRVGSNLMSGELILDTGAKYGFGVEGLFYGLTPYSRVKDYNPILGDLISDIYHMDIVIGGMKKSVDICNNPTVAMTLKMNHSIMVSNITTLFDEICVFDIKNRKLILK